MRLFENCDSYLNILAKNIYIFINKFIINQENMPRVVCNFKVIIWFKKIWVLTVPRKELCIKCKYSFWKKCIFKILCVVSSYLDSSINLMRSSLRTLLIYLRLFICPWEEVFTHFFDFFFFSFLSFFPDLDDLEELDDEDEDEDFDLFLLFSFFSFLGSKFILFLLVLPL